MACKNGVKLFNRISRDLSNYTSGTIGTTSTYGIAEHSKNVYVVRKENKMYKVVMYFVNTNRCKMMLTFPLQGLPVIFLAVSERHIAVTYPSTCPNNELILYDFVRNNSQIVHLPVIKVFGVAFLPNGDLLAVADNAIRRFQIKEQKLIPIWSCGCLNKTPLSVCVGSDGLIYVYMYDTKSITVVSPDGTLK